MTAEPDDLSEGWPDEPGAEELARFAEALRAGLPVLPDAALQRVGTRMHREIAARRRRVVVVMAAGLAAGLLLAVGLGWRFLFPPAPPPTVSPPPQTTARVDDRFTVPFAAPQTEAAPDRPALRFQDNQSLFTN